MPRIGPRPTPEAEAPKLLAPKPAALPTPTPPRYFMPYANIEELRAANPGLGIVNESDAWLTGRPYGLPGTTALQLIKRPGGYDSPSGYHYDARMLGEADNVALQLAQIVEQQKKQEESLRRIAFWQAVVGSLTVAGVAAGIALAIRGR